MRELTIEEYEQVSGGIAPLLGAAAGAAVGALGYLISTGMGANRFSAAELVGFTVAGATTFGFSAIGGGVIYGSLTGSLAGAAATNAACIYIDLINEKKDQ
ncbi:class IIb bacteriocin, lactobin A/cerein 7B family [Pseudomonadales bacterium]|nr:class IIb bacteriocin, lactobin A/cerein 7B family [Pseudomonadales bacterium]